VSWGESVIDRLISIIEVTAGRYYTVNRSSPYVYAWMHVCLSVSVGRLAAAAAAPYSAFKGLSIL